MSRSSAVEVGTAYPKTPAEVKPGIRAAYLASAGCSGGLMILAQIRAFYS
jgi:hypothetical protein